jgi:hypothetical protein
MLQFGRSRVWFFNWPNPWQPKYSSGLDSVFNRNEYQEFFLEAKDGLHLSLTTSPPSESRFSRKYVYLQVWQPYRPPVPVTESFMFFTSRYGPPLWSSGQSSWLQIRRPGLDSRHYQKNVMGLERGPLSLVSTTEELLDRKVAAPV